MIIVLKSKATQEDIQILVSKIKEYGIDVQITIGKETSILGLIGDTSVIDKERFACYKGVDKIMTVQEPFKKSNRKFHPENSVYDIAGVKVGGKKIVVMAGPCSVESNDQIIDIAKKIKASGASFLRGGAFKPRTSPYAFQGLELEGLKMLREAKQATGLPIVSELVSTRYLDQFVDCVDIIQIGARNMQNFELLKEIGHTRKPIFLKRGLSSTIEEWLMASEYIMAGGNEKVILCERGIRTYETYTRNTLDLSAIPVLKRLTHLPVMVDPSHATGLSWAVEALSKAAIAAGADGLMIEVHNDPANAKSDGAQSITPENFDSIMKKLGKYAELEEREI